MVIRLRPFYWSYAEGFSRRRKFRASAKKKCPALTQESRARFINYDENQRHHESMGGASSEFVKRRIRPVKMDERKIV